MQRILLAIAGAAAFCAAVTFLLQIAISRGLPATDIVLVTASATLLLSIAAAAFAYRAFNRANLVATELERLTRSMDAAIKDVSLRGDRDAAKLEDLSAAVSSRLRPPSARASTARDDADTDADSEHKAREAEHHAPSRKARQTPAPALGIGATEAADVDVALRRVVAGAQADLSLQPIIAAGRGEAGGFEVHFHIQPEEGKPVDLRRLSRPVADVDPAAYERLTVVSATEAVRRRLGDVSEKIPLHVAISSALLRDGLEFATVLDIFKLHPALAKAVVMSLPAELFTSGEHMAALQLLSGLGIRFAAEDWSGERGDLDEMKKAGVGAVKIAAERLLDRTKARKGAPNGAALVEMADSAGVDVIATDVQNEEDAVSLIDMGVDLMSGERLAAPRRLKTDASSGLKRA
ncbi:EAL domain-containing protein [Mesorhizobium sp. KR9-304]|uniref:EAL domain-containing protein n=1 Tax=Mesorhizobium sp. KR9-304 TaxID=3156614 RepID=UPI0032B4C72C